MDILKGEKDVPIKILCSLAFSNNEWLDVDPIKAEILPKVKRYVPKNLKELCERGIIKQRISGKLVRYRFSDPISKILVQLSQEAGCR